MWLRGGRDELTATFELTADDSGQAGRPAAYRAYQNEIPLLSGGRIIRGWKKLQDDVPGLPAAAKGKVWGADVPEAVGGKWVFRQLWADGNRLTRARWPNECRAAGTAEEQGPFQVMDAANPPRDAEAIKTWREQAWRTVAFSPQALHSFPDGKLPPDLASGPAELFTRNRGRWATLRIPIESSDGARVTTATPLGVLAFYWGAMHLMSPEKGTCFIENALSLLDCPHEWFLDRAAGRLYYLPGDGEDPSSQEIRRPASSSWSAFAAQRRLL